LLSTSAVNNVVIFVWDRYVDLDVKLALGRATVLFLKTFIRNNVTVACTGGTTMAAVAYAMVPFEGFECLCVPARRGVG